MRYKLIKTERLKGETLFHIKMIRGWLARLVGLKDYDVQYIGNGTVWHSYPDFCRQGTFTEYWLSDLEEKVEFFNPDYKQCRPTFGSDK